MQDASSGGCTERDENKKRELQRTENCSRRDATNTLRVARVTQARLIVSGGTASAGASNLAASGMLLRMVRAVTRTIRVST